MAAVGPIITYWLMVVSATFYCALDTAVKEKAFENFNKSTNAVFSKECEYHECMGKTLKMYENGKMLGEGFLNIAEVYSGFDNPTFQVDEKNLQTCLLQVNEKLNAIPRCSKFHTGIKLLNFCTSLAHPEQFKERSYILEDRND